MNLQASKAGLGSTSTILETNKDEKFSVIRADAIDSNLEVPFGWHVADNGDRMLVFDADHFIEIALKKKTVKSGPKAMLQELLDAQRLAQPDLQAQLMDNAGGAFLLIMYNFKEKDEVKSRAFLTHDIGLKKEIGSNRIAVSRCLTPTSRLPRRDPYIAAGEPSKCAGRIKGKGAVYESHDHNWIFGELMERVGYQAQYRWVIGRHLKRMPR